MKGISKGFSRAGFMMGSKVGLSNKSQDAEFNELNRKFTSLEGYVTGLIKDTCTFRDAVATMLTSQAGFATAFATIFQAQGNEISLSSSHPEAANTLRNIASYQELMAELKDMIQPDLDLIDSKVTAPLKEWQETLKKIRKTIVKRDHKLIDYDRHNNSYNKLKDKAEKSLNDEKNLFKLEQDLEQATQDYDHWNSLLKTELPQFFALATAFVTPLWQTWYYAKIGIMYNLLDKMNGWGEERYGELHIEGLENNYAAALGDIGAQIDEMTIIKRSIGTARLVAQHRQNSGSTTTSSLSRAASTSTYASKAPPPARAGTLPPPAVAAPPPYTTTAAPAGAKRAPPPPPPSKPKFGAPAPIYATALYDYTAQAEGDLSFKAGDRIEVIKKTDSDQDWWTGRVNGVDGVYPANYCQL